ncbi:MAG: hypothetical protein IT204_12185 [Fimbriimonadaceae bacterium]|nr:hypothetical protein [Fimbriimonadaceae bacterium]
MRLAGRWLPFLLCAGALCAAEPTTPAAPAAPALVTNSFSETDLRQALADIAAQAGVSIIADNSVQGLVSAEFTAAPLEQVLEHLLLVGGFVYKRLRPGFYLVTSPDPKSPNYDLVVEQRLVPLEFARAADLKKLIPTQYLPHIQLDEALNRVLVSAPQPRLQAILDLLREADTPPVQVMIEALMVETTAGDLAKFQASFQRSHFGGDNTTGVITYLENATNLLSQVLWLVARSKGSVKASPRVIAQQGREAQVAVSIQQYFQILTGQAGFGYYQLQAIEAKVGLTITPLVALSTREVTCDIAPEVGDVTGTGPNNLPIITRRTANTSVRVKDGQIIAIGGLLQHLEQQVRRKIPLLGDLPLIGELFRSQSTERSDREVTIFLVPHILDPDGSFSGPLVLDRVPAIGVVPERPAGPPTAPPLPRH